MNFKKANNMSEYLTQKQEQIILIKTFLQEIVKNVNYNYEQCLEWIINCTNKFGYVTMACYIRIIEMKEFCRNMKDELLKLALVNMNFGNYENFFSMCKDVNELYQKIFMLMMIEQVFMYMKNLCNTLAEQKKYESYIVWEVIGRYFIEEYYRLCPHENFETGNERSNQNTMDLSCKSKIYHFFQTKNIDLHDKMKLHTKQKNFYESIIEYFYNKKF
jgi:hypothetical protein